VNTAPAGRALDGVAGRRILVTGGDGLIGSAVVRLLAERDARVDVYDLGGPDAAARAVRAGAENHISGSVADAEGVAKVIAGHDAVVHLAGIAGLDGGTAEQIYTANTLGTFLVMEAAARAGVAKLVYASSINASGLPLNPHPVLPARYPWDEDEPADIADAYSLSKSVDEQSARMAWRRWGTNVIALRFPLVKSREELFRFRTMVERDPSGMAREGWAYLDLRDGIRAVVAALESSAAGAHVVGLAADDILVDRPTGELLREYAPNVPLRRPVRGRAGLVDTTRARELLGFVPQYSIHDEDQVVFAVTT
jgi:nucleoside-diphosphate-sugar epimerase